MAFTAIYDDGILFEPASIELTPILRLIELTVFAIMDGNRIAQIGEEFSIFQSQHCETCAQVATSLMVCRRKMPSLIPINIIMRKLMDDESKHVLIDRPVEPSMPQSLEAEVQGHRGAVRRFAATCREIGDHDEANPCFLAHQSPHQRGNEIMHPFHPR